MGCIGREFEFELSVLPAETLSNFLTINDPRRLLSPAQVLGRLTAETGGGHFVLTARDDVNATFTKVMYELHHSYLLGFSAAGPGRQEAPDHGPGEQPEPDRAGAESVSGAWGGRSSDRPEVDPLV